MECKSTMKRIRENFHWSLICVYYLPFFLLLLLHFLCCLLYTSSWRSSCTFFCIYFHQLVSQWPPYPTAMKSRKDWKEKPSNWEKRPGQQHLPSRKMATQFGTNVEIRKFDGKNFAQWKDMMQDVLIIQRQVEAIRHSEKPISMCAEEWRFMDEIARSTIRMHLAENVYFSMAKETTTFSLCEKLQVIYEK
mgnify:CR=1 FL=1